MKTNIMLLILVLMIGQSTPTFILAHAIQVICQFVLLSVVVTRMYKKWKRKRGKKLKGIHRAASNA